MPTSCKIFVIPTALLVTICLVLTNPFSVHGQDISEGRTDVSKSKSTNLFIVKYADTLVKYTENNLNLAKLRNSKSRVISGTRMEELKEEVEVAKKLLEAAQAGKKQQGQFLVFLRHAQLVHRISQDEWSRTKKVHDANPTDISELVVEKLRLRTELSKLNVEEGRSLLDSSLEEQTRWKFRVIFDEFNRLHSNR